MPAANYPRGLTADITAPFPATPLNTNLIGYWFTPYASSTGNTDESEAENKVTVPAMSDNVLSNPIKIRSLGNHFFLYNDVEGHLMLIDSILLTNRHNGKHRQEDKIYFSKDEVIRLLAGGAGKLKIKPRNSIHF